MKHNPNSTSALEPADNLTNVPGFRVDGALVIDLRVPGSSYDANDLAVDRKIQFAAHAPSGADVTFIVSARQFAPIFAIGYLIENGAHLNSVKVQSDCPDTISKWFTALRGEEI